MLTVHPFFVCFFPLGIYVFIVLNREFLDIHLSFVALLRAHRNSILFFFKCMQVHKKKTIKLNLEI